MHVRCPQCGMEDEVLYDPVQLQYWKCPECAVEFSIPAMAFLMGLNPTDKEDFTLFLADIVRTWRQMMDKPKSSDIIKRAADQGNVRVWEQRIRWLEERAAALEHRLSHLEAKRRKLDSSEDEEGPASYYH